MQASSLTLFAFGVIWRFFPDALVGGASSSAASVPVQLFGGTLMAFAVLNWIGRRAILGGIYGRPIVVANFALGMITAGTLMAATLSGRMSRWGWALVCIFMLQAVGFFWLMRRPPWDASAKAKPDRGSV